MKGSDITFGLRRRMASGWFVCLVLALMLSLMPVHVDATLGIDAVCVWILFWIQLMTTQKRQQVTNDLFRVCARESAWVQAPKNHVAPASRGQWIYKDRIIEHKMMPRGCPFQRHPSFLGSLRPSQGSTHCPKTPLLEVQRG